MSEYRRKIAEKEIYERHAAHKNEEFHFDKLSEFQKRLTVAFLKDLLLKFDYKEDYQLNKLVRTLTTGEITDE